MRRQLSNSMYGLLDYAAYPFGMLAVAPLVLHNLGVAQYGVWTVAISIVNLTSIVASGFGDANIQRIAVQRGAGQQPLLRFTRAAMGIHLLLGVIMAGALWASAPGMADHLAPADGALRQTSLSCIRIAGFATIVRSVETVCVSTQRAFERYGAAVRLSIAGRLLSLGAAAVFSVLKRDIVDIMLASLAFTVLALLAQMLRLAQLLQSWKLTPSFDRIATKEIIQFGVFSWMVSVAGVVFSQADRLIGGASIGASAIVTYALCAQVSQPVYGMTAAGLHFLFPYVASRQADATTRQLREILGLAFLANVVPILVAASLLLVLSQSLFHLLAGDAIARACATLFPSVLAGSALLACSITGTYTMLALGRVRHVALLNVVGATAMVLVITCFLPRFGLLAIIGGRIVFAILALLVYIPLVRTLRSETLPPDELAPNRAAAEGA